MASKKDKPKPRMERNRTKPRKRPASQILASAQDALRATKLGLTDFRGNDPNRQITGLRNLIMNGRTVTFPLQLLWEVGEPLDEHGHGAWYRERVSLGTQDPVPRFFNALRNLVEKEGILAVTERRKSQGMQVDYLNTDDLHRAAPPGTTGISVDMDGLVHFHRQDGSEVVTAWPGIRTISAGEFHFDDTPADLANRTVDDLAQSYVQLLEEIVTEAVIKFGHLP